VQSLHSCQPLVLEIKNPFAVSGKLDQSPLLQRCIVVKRDASVITGRANCDSCVLAKHYVAIGVSVPEVVPDGTGNLAK
jgi:hypothetical protein